MKVFFDNDHIQQQKKKIFNKNSYTLKDKFYNIMSLGGISTGHFNQ